MGKRLPLYNTTAKPSFRRSDDEEDEEAEKLKAQRLEEYRKKKEGKTKPAAKSMVTLDVKPWGSYTLQLALEDSS
jgi:elongation factor 1-beta